MKKGANKIKAKSLLFYNKKKILIDANNHRKFLHNVGLHDLQTDIRGHLALHFKWSSNTPIIFKILTVE